MEFDALDTARALAQIPPETIAPPGPKRSVWSAPVRAVGAAAAEMGALAMRGLTAAPPGSEAAGGTTEEIGRSVAQSLRDTSESLAPDPATAGKAEQLVFGLTRGVGKAVAYGLTTGPAAPFLFGTDEGVTQADQLERKGVDSATAAKVGAVAGVVNALGFAIPAAGQTVARTFGLATLSGPASFVAQQAASQSILERANYHEIAQSFDPADPWGLALSALPYGFGAWAMRSRARGASGLAAPEVAPKVAEVAAEPAHPVADAALPGKPEPLPGKVEPESGKPAGPAVQPEHVDAAMVHNITEASQFMRVFESPPMESLADFSARVLPAASDALAPKFEPDTFLQWLRQQGGVSFADKFDITGEASGVRLNRGGVFRKAGRGLDDLAQIAESEGWLPPGSTADVDGGVPQLRDMLQRAMAGERIKPLAQQFDDIAARQMATGEQLRAEHLAHRLEMLGVDPAPARGNADVMSAYLDQHEPRLLRQALADIAEPEAPASHVKPNETPTDAATPANPGAQDGAARSPEGQAQAEAGGATSAGRPEPGSGGPDAALIQSVRARADQIVTEAPDLVVRHTEDGQPVTARQELERIRREAAEGTDDALGAGDAPLLDVAVQCALSLGA